VPRVLRVSEPERPEQDRRSVGGPAVDDVVVPPARRQRSVRGVPRELLRLAAVRRDHVDLLVPVVLPREGDPLSVRGEAREDLDPRMRGETRRGAALDRRLPDVSRVAEGDLVAVHVGKSQELGGRRRGQSGQEKGEREKRQTSHDGFSDQGWDKRGIIPDNGSS
jgi:hypothetical protein